MSPVIRIQSPEDQFNFVLSRLEKSFGNESDKGGVMDNDGFSFDFSVPEVSVSRSLSVQVGILDTEKVRGYIQCYLYDENFEPLEEKDISFESEEEFKKGVTSALRFLKSMTKKVKEGKR
ncbi:hypothetical protein [Rossellomorea marisflavi]|uniref:hypothetical protein n=1 Tax=Rossellomorea marisflavi TaxID=189381 RepID=UPI003FA11893